MKKTTIVIIVALLLGAACDPVKRVEKLKQRICPLCMDSTISKDSSSVTSNTTYGDTIINILVSNDTVYLDTAVAVTPTCDFAPVSKVTDYCRVIVQRRAGKLSISILPDLDYKVRIENAIRETLINSYMNNHEIQFIKVPTPYPQKYIPHAYLIAFWLWIIVIAAAIIYLLVKASDKLSLIFGFVLKLIDKIKPSKK